MIQKIPYSQTIHRNQGEYHRIGQALKQETVHPLFTKDRMRQLPLPEEITIIRLPHFWARDATKLIEARAAIESHFGGQYCTATASGKPEFDSFVRRFAPQYQPKLLRADQAHLFEHLIFPEADRLKLQPTELDATVTIVRNRERSRGHRDRIRYVVVMNNTFRQPEFDDLCMSVWHWLGQALAGNGYPTQAQLRQILEVRSRTLRQLPKEETDDSNLLAAG